MYIEREREREVCMRVCVCIHICIYIYIYIYKACSGPPATWRSDWPLAPVGQITVIIASSNN